MTILGLICAAVAVYHVVWESEHAVELRAGAEESWYGGSAAAQWATEPRILLHALRLLVWPFPQSSDYSWQAFTPSASWLDSRTLGALALLTGAGWCAAVAVRRDRALGFAAALVALSYLPMLHILPSAHNMEPFAEHWLYLPVFGVALAAARLLQSAPHARPAFAAAVLLIAIAAAANTARSRVWRDAETFWSEAARAQPRCSRAWGALAVVMKARGEVARAEILNRLAIALRPEDPRPRLNLAGILVETGRREEARALLDETRRLPLGRRAYVGGVQTVLGRIALAEGRPAHAARLMKASTDPSVRRERGWALAQAGDWHMAELVFRTACRLDPAQPWAQNDLGLLLLESGRPDEALPTLERAWRMAPDDLGVAINLGRALAESGGDLARARVLLGVGLRRAPDSIPALLAFSEAERRAGRLRRAEDYARRAAKLEGSARTSRQLTRVRRDASDTVIRPRPRRAM